MLLLKDDPKTLGVAISCPISLDMEVGDYDFRSKMHSGKICRIMQQFDTKLELILQPSEYERKDSNEKVLQNSNRSSKKLRGISNLRTKKSSSKHSSNEIAALFSTSPQSDRSLKIHHHMQEEQELTMKSEKTKSLQFVSSNHGVCTVQTFRNSLSGHFMYLFVVHYAVLGYKVIVYDRFGYHYDIIKSLLLLFPHSIFYHPYTVLQLVLPDKYNQQYMEGAGSDMKYYYKQEINKGHSSKRGADTSDQDSDKTKTYDYCRVEYAHLDSIMFLDSDEYFYCPFAQSDYYSSQVITDLSESKRLGYFQSVIEGASFNHHKTKRRKSDKKLHDNFIGGNLQRQRRFQQTLMTKYRTLGVEEMRLVRLPYAGLITPPELQLHSNQSAALGKTSKQIDLTNRTEQCMSAAYSKSNFDSLESVLNTAGEMFACWSSLSNYDKFPKSSDLYGKCPFHYNHWSCDGMLLGESHCSDCSLLCYIMYVVYV